MNSSTLGALICGVLAAGLTFLILGAFRRKNIGINRELIIGSISSILAAIIIWLGINIFSSLLLPWYNEFSYKGLDLSGAWTIKVGPNGSFSNHLGITADLKQITDRVSGSITVVFKNRPGQVPLRYIINGFRREQFLALTIEKRSSKQLGVGTSIVQTVNVGNTLRGYLCAYDASAGKLRCDECEWTRIPDE